MLASTLSAITGFLAIVNALPPGSSQAPPSLPSPNITAIIAHDPGMVPSYTTGGLKREKVGNLSSVTSRSSAALGKRSCPAYSADGNACVGSSTLTWGDSDNGGTGVVITAGGSSSNWYGFYFYENYCDCVPT